MKMHLKVSEKHENVHNNKNMWEKVGKLIGQTKKKRARRKRYEKFEKYEKGLKNKLENVGRSKP